MADNHIKIIVGADTKDLQKGAQDASKSVAVMSNAVKGANKSMASLKPGANEAAFALTNVGRVAQDLPFGFMGIQNNLNPLLESLQRLKASTGSTSTALKAMGSSLVGAGGIGLALSVASSAILIFQNGIMGFNRKTKEAAEETDKYKSAIEGISSSVAEEATRVSVLVQALQGETLSKKERNSAIEELKRINPQYFSQLKDEKGLIDNLSTAYSSYIFNLRNQFAAKAVDKKIAELFDRKLKLEAEVTPTISNINNDEINKKRAQLQAELKKLGGLNIDFGNLDLSKMTPELQKMFDLKKKIAALDVPVFDLTKTAAEIKLIEQQIDSLLIKRSQFGVSPVTSKDKDKTKKETDALKEQISALEKLRSETGLLKVEETKLAGLKIDLLYRDGIKDGFDAGQIERLVNAIRRELELKMAAAFDVPLAVQPKIKVDVAGSVGPLSDNFNQSSLDAIAESANKAREAINDLSIDIAQVSRAVGQFLTPIFSEFFDSLLSGAQTAFQAIGSFLKNLVKQLASTIATAAALAVIIQALGLGGGAGFGSLFKKFLGFSGPRLADGGLVTRPTIAMIGEGGAEAVVPLSKIGSVIGSSSMNVEFIESRISGGDIFQIWKVHNNSNRRMA